MLIKVYKCTVCLSLLLSGLHPTLGLGTKLSDGSYAQSDLAFGIFLKKKKKNRKKKKTERKKKTTSDKVLTPEPGS